MARVTCLQETPKNLISTYCQDLTMKKEVFLWSGAMQRYYLIAKNKNQGCDVKRTINMKQPKGPEALTNQIHLNNGWGVHEHEKQW